MNKNRADIVKAVLNVVWQIFLLVLLFQNTFWGVLLTILSYMVGGISRWWKKNKDKPFVTLTTTKHRVE